MQSRLREAGGDSELRLAPTRAVDAVGRAEPGIVEEQHLGIDRTGEAWPAGCRRAWIPQAAEQQLRREDSMTQRVTVAAPASPEIGPSRNRPFVPSTSTFIRSTARERENRVKQDSSEPHRLRTSKSMSPPSISAAVLAADRAVGTPGA
jgi:hypothetical protein